MLAFNHFKSAHHHLTNLLLALPLHYLQSLSAAFAPEPVSLPASAPALLACDLVTTDTLYTLTYCSAIVVCLL